MNLTDIQTQTVLESLRLINLRLGVIEKELETIMATQQDVINDLNAVKDQLTKIGTETTSLLTKITDLEKIINDGPVKPELLAALDAVKAQAKVVDDMVPDAPPPPPPGPVNP